MRRRLSAVAYSILLLTFVLSPWHITTAQAEGKPKIVIDEMRHDLGEIFETDVYKHKFTIKNDGDADLVIEKVKPG